MKGFGRQTGIDQVIRILLVHLFLIVTPPTLAETKAASQTVLLINSNDNTFFQRTIDSLQAHTSSDLVYKVTTLKKVKNGDSEVKNSSLVVTLGISAAEFANENIKSIPVIHSYITKFQYHRHQENSSNARHSSILLDQPLSRYLQFIKLISGIDRVGIVRNKESRIDEKRINHLRSTTGVSLQQEIYNDNDNPLNKVRNLMMSSDALLSLPDPQIYNRQSLKGILLTTYRQNKPVFSYSPSHVKSGALASIYSSPESIGVQIADLVGKLLGNRAFKAKKYYYANGFDIEINHRVAKSLGLELIDENRVLDQLKNSEPESLK